MSEFCEKLEEKLKEVMTSERGNFRFMEPMKRHTTFRIGGPAAVFISPGSEEELREVLNLLKEENIPWTILGNGSNLLVSDEGFKGAVISMSEGWAYSGVLREDEKAGKTLIRAGAGELLSRTARLAMECSLTGMEFASGIPGTIGGALVMNAGAYGSEICNVLSRAKVMTTEGEILELPAEELELGYRTSCIPKKNYIVLEAVFELNKGSKEAMVRSIISTSSVKTTPAIGALKIPETAPAAPHPTSSISVLWSIRKILPKFEPMAEPVSTIGASAPTDPPQPMVMAEAKTEDHTLCRLIRLCLREMAYRILVTP